MCDKTLLVTLQVPAMREYIPTDSEDDDLYVDNDGTVVSCVAPSRAKANGGLDPSAPLDTAAGLVPGDRILVDQEKTDPKTNNVYLRYTPDDGVTRWVLARGTATRVDILVKVPTPRAETLWDVETDNGDFKRTALPPVTTVENIIDIARPYLFSRKGLSVDAVKANLGDRVDVTFVRLVLGQYREDCLAILNVVIETCFQSIKNDKHVGTTYLYHAVRNAWDSQSMSFLFDDLSPTVLDICGHCASRYERVQACTMSLRSRPVSADDILDACGPDFARCSFTWKLAKLMSAWSIHVHRGSLKHNTARKRGSPSPRHYATRSTRKRLRSDNLY